MQKLKAKSQKYNAKNKKSNLLNRAVDFHGHLGPYLVLGILAGSLALSKLKTKKYFGLEVKVWGANRKPKSCIIDGLQLSTGATYGKGNINKFDGSLMRIQFHNKLTGRSLELELKENLLERLHCLKGHKDSEEFAKELFKVNPITIFNLTIYN